jgi:hypothetical protein
VLTSTPDVWEYLDLSESEEQKNNARNVFTTWNLSIQFLNPTNWDGQQKVTLLSLFAFFDINDISEELFKAYHDTLLGSEERPAWLAVFEDDNRDWSHKRFVDVMLAFQRLSLISTVEKRDDAYIHLSLHLLVRDWLILRLTGSDRKSYFSMASKILACSLLQYRNGHDYAYQWGYRMTQKSRNIYLSHTTISQTNFKRFSPLCPTMLDYKPDRTAMSAESVLADFFQDSGLFDNANSLYEWIWDNSTSEDGRCLRVKSRARNCNIDTLALQHRLDDSLRIAKESLEYWKAERADDEIIIDSMYLLGMAFSFQQSTASGTEGEIVFRDLLRKLEQVIGDGNLSNARDRHSL